VTSSGSPYARFRRALATGNLAMVRAAAVELPQVALDDALEVCVLVADREPHLYERAALRWLARFIVERRDVTLTSVAEAADTLALLRLDPDAARAELAHLLRA
jgi:hypothetical protein